MPHLRDRALPHHGFVRPPLVTHLLIGTTIVHTPRVIESQAKALLAARAALEKQAESVVVMDLRSFATVTEFFVICTAGSVRQISAISDHIESTLTQHGSPVWHTEGLNSSSRPTEGMSEPLHWVLMDCGEIVVHLFDQRSRTFYRLEELWADAPRVPLATTTA